MNMVDDMVRNTQERAAQEGQRECDFCGEMLWYVEHEDYLGEEILPPDEIGEFYNQERVAIENPHIQHKIGHAQCGIDWGWEVA